MSSLAPTQRRGPMKAAGELDELTVARARRGDREALGALARWCGPRVHALAARMMVGRGADAADDVAQETLVKVVRGIGRFDPRGAAKLSTWVLTIATRTCIDALRRRRVTAKEIGIGFEIEHDAPDDGPLPDERVAQRDLARRVRRAMADLPADQRAALVLRAYHDCDYPEIAASLGVEVGTVKSRLSRARAALRLAVADVEDRS